MTVRRINFVSAAVSFQISILTSYQSYNSFLAAATAYMLRAWNPISPPRSTPFFRAHGSPGRVKHKPRLARLNLKQVTLADS